MACYGRSPVRILRDRQLQPFNSLSLCARADALVAVESNEQLLAACHWAQERELPLVPLGQGSNVVLAGDLHALVVRQQTPGIELLAERADVVTLRVAAGEDWHSLVQWTLDQGLYGLENLALIPGTVGAAPIQNIGAYGVELKSFVQAVHAIVIATGEQVCLTNSECKFAYRDSVFKGRLQDQLVITAVDLVLSRSAAINIGYPALAAQFKDNSGKTITPQQVFAAVVNIRSSKLPDPAVVPNAGSFFKNPQLPAEQAATLAARFPGLPAYPQPDGSVKLAAAWMIEYCGWKAYREHDIGVHPEHALVLVNYGNNRGEQLLDLARRIAATVRETFAIELHIEPRIYG